MSIWKNGKLVAGGRQTTPLLSFMWADHILDDISWLRADTFSWQNGAIYRAVYQHLANDIDGKSLQSETVGGTTIQFYLADDGHKICPESEINNVIAIYNAIGVAWYYIIDVPNKRFKLPRSKHEHYGDRPVVGTGKSLGITNGTTNGGMAKASGNYVSVVGEQYNQDVTSAAPTGSTPVNGVLGITTDATKSGMVSTPVEDTVEYKYLYFYVGNFTQTAIENTAGLNAELFNGKADLDLGNVPSNIDYVVDFQAPTAQNNYTWYKKYRNGWVEQGGLSSAVTRAGTTVSLPITMADTNYVISATARKTSVLNEIGLTANPVATTYFTLYMGAYNGGSPNLPCYWEVKGMAA